MQMHVANDHFTISHKTMTHHDGTWKLLYSQLSISLTEYARLRFAIVGEL